MLAAFVPHARDQCVLCYVVLVLSNVRACLPASVDLFFEELTGSHTQFYDKFTFRSLTAQLLEHLWTLRPYRESIIRYSQDSAK